MVQPNFIPRTLRGVGGVRLIDLPGVQYPPEMLHVRPGHNARNGLPYEAPPAWGISTREAAGILKCTSSAVRITLHRRQVRCRAVREPGMSLTLYWDRSEVDRLADRRHPVVGKVPAKLVTPTEACKLLGLARSSLHRYTCKRWLHPVHVRVPSGRGLHHRSFFRRAEVVKLAHHLRALRERRRQIQEAAAGGGSGA